MRGCAAPNSRTAPGARIALRNGAEEVRHRGPQEIMDEIAVLDAERAAVLETIRGLL